MKNKIYLIAFFCSLFNLANAQTLLANYPVLTNLVDATGNNSDYTLTAGMLAPSNGICQTGGFSTDYGLSPNIANFDPTSFQIEVEFNPNNIPGPVNWTTIVVGGNSYRWIGLNWNYNGKLGFTYNNGNYTETAGDVVPGNWHTAILKYKNNSICIELDGVIVYQNCIDTLIHAGNFNFSSRNFSTGTVIDGCFKNLKISSDPILPIWAETNTEVICLGDSIAVGNNYYSQTGIYVDTVVSPLGCMTEITTDLTVPLPASGTDVQTACDAYTWIDGNTYNSSNNTATLTLTSAAGCDSIVTLDLTITPLVITASIVNDLTITSDQTGDSYEWIDCSNGNQIIPGETNQLFIASENGDYAVIVTSGNCSDTSNCVMINNVGVEDIEKVEELIVYPNPSNDGVFFVNNHESIIDLIVYDALGREMSIKYHVTNGEINCENLDPGKYIIKVITEEQEFSRELIILND
ncbi:MAG: hypothetical protein ACI8XB_001920 [Patiriisocius sp.]|jgi:hypothetical protein